MAMRVMLSVCAVFIVLAARSDAAVLQYGDKDLLGLGTYSSEPTTGATLQGLAPNVVTLATFSFGHGFPFSPMAGDYAGTDQIYVGSNQTAVHDGYATYSGRARGPQVITMDYSSLIPAGEEVVTLTLGIAADDFQFPAFGQPFLALVNGVSNAALTNQLNSLNQTGPQVRFFTIGIDPAILLPNQTLTLSIDQGGTGGDGWAIDFLTVGVTTTAVPEPAGAVLMALGVAAGAMALRRRR